MELKHYQRETLHALRAYFQECTRTNDPDLAFYALARDRWGEGRRYRAAPGLAGLPYVCVRIPTGGGKTLVAAHAAALATRELLHAERSLVVWLVPSNAILTQTLAALRDRQHPYRQALEVELGALTVLDVGEALYLSRPTLDTSTVILVTTMQAFRVEATEGRKVYEQNGALMDHFASLPPELRLGLELHANGQPVSSLANVMRLRSPVLIVDEAHNARTELSFETLARLGPACILEFTATPDTDHHPSNVLHTVSAAELKAEEMIKLPVQFYRRENWVDVLTDALAMRDQLETVSQRELEHTGEYLRPIMLIQAQPRRGAGALTVEVVKQALINDHKIDPDQIREATGENNELYAIPNLEDPRCPVRYIITVQALREGWDCPFAYVLCTVAELKANTAVEQILGRVLRMPKAKRKRHPELNRAYTFATSSSFETTAKALKDALVENGFSRQEVDDLVATTEPPNRPPMFGVWQPSVSAVLSAPLDLSQLPPETRVKVQVEAATNTLTFIGDMTETDRLALARQTPALEDQSAIEALYRQARGFAGHPLRDGPPSPAERGVEFKVPMLAYRQGALLEPFEDTHFRDDVLWNLAEADAALSETEFASERPAVQGGEVDVNETTGQVTVKPLAALRARQMALALDRWTVGDLILWLTRHIEHTDLDTEDVGRFLERLLRGLMQGRGLTLEYLVHNKTVLRAAAARKIDAHRRAVYEAQYQLLLLPDSPLVVDPEECFSFEPDGYAYNELYRGSYTWQRHFYPQVGNLPDDGEETDCAIFLDNQPQVECWVRNVERQKNSFYLQTSTDKFYPDFVCKLTNGRILVVEYKSVRDWTNADSQEKRNLGEFWAARGGERCLFVMPRGPERESIVKALSG